MEGNFQQTSFIPKKPMANSFVKPSRGGFFGIVAIVVFLTVLALAGGVFGYTYFLSNNLEKTKTTLETETKKFDTTLLNEMARLDARMKNTKQLIDQHVSLSSFFKYLGTVTLENVRFSSFGYSVGATSPTIVMIGQAKSFASVALQASELIKPENQNYVRNPVFGDPTLDPSGNVGFNLKTEVNPSAFTYRASLKGIDFAALRATSTATSTASTTKATASTTPAATSTKPR